MNFPLNPLMHEVDGYLYSNLLLVCAVAVVVGATVFFRSYGTMKFKSQ